MRSPQNKRSAPLVLMGPQRHRPILSSVLERLGVDGPFAAVTAGWEEREAEDLELEEHLSGRVTNLDLFTRGERVFEEDPELFTALRRRHDRMRDLQEIYRLRLRHGLDAVCELLARNVMDDLRESAVEHAFASVRALDHEHLSELHAVQDAFEEEMRPAGRPAVRRERAQLKEILSGSEALLIAGGHVTVLLNRLKLFGILDLWGDRPLVAWSAGAMVLGEAVVLFHDSPPQGSGYAEVYAAGLGLYDGLVPLPHARLRLKLADPTRVRLLARRFAPNLCVPLDAGHAVSSSPKGWMPEPGTRVLTGEGGVEEVRVA